MLDIGRQESRDGKRANGRTGVPGLDKLGGWLLLGWMWSEVEVRAEKRTEKRANRRTGLPGLKISWVAGFYK